MANENFKALECWTENKVENNINLFNIIIIIINKANQEINTYVQLLFVLHALRVKAFSH